MHLGNAPFCSTRNTMLLVQNYVFGCRFLIQLFVEINAFGKLWCSHRPIVLFVSHLEREVNDNTNYNFFSPVSQLFIHNSALFIRIPVGALGNCRHHM